jgi:predicted signal transduction protein with EAL and GGDEF domain
LDDFGTGYSSISVLRDLPVTGVKLDLRFVHDLTTGASQANALALGLSGLVNGMHLTGIAEGIETPMQAHILRAQGWQYGQGYYFGRPAPMPVSTDPPTARSSPEASPSPVVNGLFRLRRATCFSRLRPAGAGGYTPTTQPTTRTGRGDLIERYWD